MKAGIFLAVLLLRALPLRANDAPPAPVTIDTLVQQRIEVLTQIIAYTKKQYDVGEVTEAYLLNTTLELYALHRDAAKNRAEQIAWQEKILAIEEKKKASLERLKASGTVGQIEILRATARVLAAEQKRLELQAAK